MDIYLTYRRETRHPTFTFANASFLRLLSSDDAHVTSLECRQITQQNLTVTCHWLAETPFKGNIEFEIFNVHMTKLVSVLLSSNESTYIARRLLSENGVYAVKVAAQFRIVRMTSKLKSRQRCIRQCALKAIRVVCKTFSKI